MRLWLGCLLALPGCMSPQTGLLSSFEATLAEHDSATAALAKWCAERHIAPVATIVAIPVAGSPQNATAALRAALGVSTTEPLAYRHVRLACGETVLSDARNWYVPARLPPTMIRQLQAGTTPFGTVVAPLNFRRERGPAKRGAADVCPADTVLTHSAVLRLPDNRAISAVIECYTPAVLAGDPGSRGAAPSNATSD